MGGHEQRLKADSFRALKRVVPGIVVIAVASSCTVATHLRTSGGRASSEDYRSWSAYGGGPEHLKYSALDQITRETVRQLEVAWTYDTGEDPALGAMRTTPLLADGLLYVAGPEGGVHAIEPGTGARRWVFRIENPGERSPYFRGAPWGLMYWRQGDVARIYTVFGRYVYAVDARTGHAATEFGNGGRIDLREDLGRDPHRMEVELSVPGVVYKDLIILGSRVGEQTPAAPGHIRALDARTGRMRWIFHTVPQPGEFGYETWPPDAWTYSGGANSWSGVSLDAVRGVVYLATGSAASDFYGADRIGDNLFANSVIALNAATGARIWHQQIIRHDLWDRDLPAAPVLVTVERNGRRIDAVAQTTKSGHVWVLDRDTGKPLFRVREVAAPPSDLPGEIAARTQRVPELPRPFARQTFTEADVTDRTPEAHAAVLAQLRALDPHHPFGPPTLRGRVLFPGFDGGAEWGGGAFDPETGLFYVNANEMPWILRVYQPADLSGMRRASEVYGAFCAACHGADRRGTDAFPSLIGVRDRLGRDGVGRLIYTGAGRMPGFSEQFETSTIVALANYIAHGSDDPIQQASSDTSQPYNNRFRNSGYAKFLDPQGYPASTPPWGTLTAINLNTGEQVWRIPFGQYPALVAQGLPDTGSENYGGPVVTGGGVLFIGATLYDRKFRAFDKRTGKLLWEHQLPAAGVGTPAVYDADGRQFVVIAAGGRVEGEPRGASYIAFALPRRR